MAQGDDDGNPRTIYWIVDPQQKLVTVFALQGEAYHLHAELKPGMQLASVLLAGFTLPISDIFAAALPPFFA